MIRPCIKCGGDAPLVKDCGYSSFNPHWVQCSQCGHRSASDRSGPKAAIEMWNAQAEEADFIKELANLRADNERLKSMLSDLSIRSESTCVCIELREAAEAEGDE